MSHTAKYTKEQWLVENNTVYALEFERENTITGKPIYRNRFSAFVQGYIPKEELESNSRLIASAPDLLEALQLARAGIEAHLSYARGKDDYKMFHAAAFSLEKIDSVIAKALGQSK